MRPLRLRFEENANLMSANLFNARIKKLRRNERIVTWLSFYVICLLVFMCAVVKMHTESLEVYVSVHRAVAFNVAGASIA